MTTILWATKLYRPRNAGSEFYAEGVCRELAALGHEVHVMTSTSEGWHRISDGGRGVKVWRCRRMADFGTICREVKPRVVLVNYEWTRNVLLQSDRPVAVVMHNTWSAQSVPLNLRLRVSLWIANSAPTLAGTVPEARARRHLIVTPPLDMARVAVRPGAARDAVGVIGLSPEKGGRLFWALAERMPDIRFVAQPGGYGVQEVHRLPNVEVVPTGDVRDLFDRCKIFLFPSRFESWGMAGLEAQANGGAVLASDLPTLHHSLGDGAAFLPADPAAWEPVIRKLLSDEKMFSSLTERGKLNADRRRQEHADQVHALSDTLKELAR